ncbi:MAG: DUF2865 domain-containing protein [Hyphomicrobiaceae bacterium]|nr:DUF2865 domain-containing protein [Hyphomicrobiaceae bacterium]
MSDFSPTRSYCPSRLSVWVAVVVGLGIIALGVGGWAAINGPTRAATVASGQIQIAAVDGRHHNALAVAIGFGDALVAMPDALSIETHASTEETNSEWAERLSDTKFWSNIQRQKGSGTGGWGKASGLTRDAPRSIPMPTRVSPALSKSGRGNNGDDDDDSRSSKSSGTYRTMCVRLCDGFYWPISFSTTQDKFDRDSQACESSCGGPKNARLFSYPNPGGSTDDLEDTNGTAYKKLPKAFSFRVSVDPSCKCRAHPWEDAARDQHKLYALESGAVKKSPAAKAEIDELRKKIASQASLITPTDAPAARGKQSQRHAGEERRSDASVNVIAIDPERRMSQIPVHIASRIPMDVPAQRQSRPDVQIALRDRRDQTVGPSADRVQKPAIVRLHRGLRTPVEVQVEYGSGPIRRANVSDSTDDRVTIIRR